MAPRYCARARRTLSRLPFQTLLFGTLTIFFLTPARAEHTDRTLKIFGAELSTAIFSIQQDIVAADNPGGYYWEKYQHAEPFYWVNIPLWMKEDATRRAAHRILDI